MIQTWFDNLTLKLPGKNPLLPGVWYDYTSNQADGAKPTCVAFAPSREPLIATYQSKPYVPSSSNAPTLRQLMLDRKVFVNLVGGRAIDDKKFFKEVVDLARSLNPGQSVGGSPVTLSDEEYKKIKQEPDDYVVKRTDGSGGDGVYVLKTLSQAEKERMIQEVMDAQGEGVTIQRFTPSLSEPTVFRKAHRQRCQSPNEVGN